MFKRETTALKTGEPVSFRLDGFRLFGTLSHPPAGAARQNTGIVLINPGPTDRNGPQRLYYKIAERFSKEGYPVLRFDARGVGESEGECYADLEGAPILDPFTRIQTGIWIPDTLAALDFLMQRAGVQRVVLGGLCGGAITALLAGAEHPDVAGVFLLGNPPTLSSKTADVKDLPESVLARDAKLYWKKLLRPSAWMRLLTFKTDFKTLFKVIGSRLQPSVKPKVENGAEAENSKLNPFYMRSFKAAVARGKKLLFVYAENDYLWNEFKEYFVPTLQAGSARPFDLKTIPQANHNLTEAEWQEQFHEALSAWLGRFADRS